MKVIATEEETAELTLNSLARFTGPASAAILAEETAGDPAVREELLAAMRDRLREMRDSVCRGLDSDRPSRTGMVGWNAKLLWGADDALRAPLLKRVQAYAMAVNEENARMGRIVAAPTAGSAGTLPGALIAVADHLGKSDEELLGPLVLAAGIGQIIGRSMFIAGSTGGCQAEIGSSAAAQLALAGVESPIPPDEVVQAMASVGRLLPPELRETGEGGLAATPTGKRIALEMAE